MNNPASTSGATPGPADRRPWTSARLLVIDVEGNGQQPPDLIEVAAVPIIAGQIGAARSWMIRPPRPVTWQARRVHGINTHDLAGSPTLTGIADEITATLTGNLTDDTSDSDEEDGGAISTGIGVDVLVGHHVSIDLAVLTRSLPGWHPPPAIDTLRLARALHPGLPSHRLGALAETFDLNTPPISGHAHRAAYDATLTARLLIRLAAELGRDVAGDADLAALISASTRSTTRPSTNGQATLALDDLPGLHPPGTGGSGR